MIINSSLAKSKGCDQKDRWATPQNLFDELNAEFGFTLDPCCELHTAKCPYFFTEQDNGLIQDWSGEVVFVNPPYSRGNIDNWAKKCYDESLNGVVIVALLPVSTSAKWFHKYVWGKSEIRFIKGRVKFQGAAMNAPFSSMLAIYNNSIDKK